jgi:hypothetical protein
MKPETKAKISGSAKRTEATTSMRPKTKAKAGSLSKPETKATTSTARKIACVYAGGNAQMQYFYEKEQQVILQCIGNGQTMVHGSYLYALFNGSAFVNATEVEPFVLDIPDAEPTIFVHNEIPKSHIVVEGVIDQMQDKRNVLVRSGATVTMREVMIKVAHSGGTSRLPLSLWGERLANLNLRSKMHVVLLNARTDSYQRMPRLSLGDTGTLLMKPKTKKGKSIRETLNNDGPDSPLELPEGFVAKKKH